MLFDFVGVIFLKASPYGRGGSRRAGGEGFLIPNIPSHPSCDGSSPIGRAFDNCNILDVTPYYNTYQNTASFLSERGGVLI